MLLFLSVSALVLGPQQFDGNYRSSWAVTVLVEQSSSSSLFVVFVRVETAAGTCRMLKHLMLTFPDLQVGPCCQIRAAG